MIEGIDSITYGIPDTPEQWERAKQFLQDWGLKLCSISGEQCVFETLNGSNVYVTSQDDKSLSPAMETGATLRRVTWAVNSQISLNELCSKAQNASLTNAHFKVTDKGFSICDPHGLEHCFQVKQKIDINLQGSLSNPFGAISRVDVPSPIYERATPVEIGHVVLFSDCLEAAEAFYTALGFITSDRYPGRGVFMRCSATGGHHDVFLLQLPNKAKGLNHVAFTVRDIHEVFGGGMHMSRCGWKTQLGPGRHPISSAYFWYFENPCGGLIEYNADEDHLTPAWKPRDFSPSPTAFAEWAIDGGIDGNTRRQPNVAAGEKFLTEKR